VKLDEGVLCSFVALKLSKERYFGLERQLGLVQERKERERERRVTVRERKKIGVVGEREVET
jgi:hypothetical protein